MAHASTPGAITERLRRIERGEDPQLLARLRSGHAILANQQPEPLAGCCMLLPALRPGADGAPVAPASLNDLPRDDRAAFLADLALLGDAILAATGAERINYLILCNQVPELHGHAVPRFAHEDPDRRRLGPFEAYDFPAAPRADVAGTHRELFDRLRAELRSRAGPGSAGS